MLYREVIAVCSQNTQNTKYTVWAERRIIYIYIYIYIDPVRTAQ